MQQVRKVFDGTIMPDMAAPVRPAAAATMASLLRWQGDSVQQAGRWVPLPPTQDVATWDATSRVYAHWADKAYGRYFLFVYDGALGRHLIYCYDGSAMRVVLDEADMDEALLWDEDHPPQATMIGRYLIWTDGQSDPMMIDVESAMATYDNTYTAVDGLDVHPYTLPLTSADDLYVLHRPPRYGPQAFKGDSSGAPDGPYEANVVEHVHLQFAVRYLYVDGAMSVVGPYSAVLPPNAEGDTYDAVQVALPSSERIPARVKRVIWMVREGIDGPWFEFAESEGQALADHNDGTQLTAWYGKRRLGTPVGESDSARLWDSVPIRAMATASAGGRLLFGATEEDRWHDGVPSLTVAAETNSPTSTGVAGKYVLVTAVCPGEYDQAVFVQITGQGPADGYYWTDYPASAFLDGTLPVEVLLSPSDKSPATTDQELIDLVSACGGGYDPALSGVDYAYTGTDPTVYGVASGVFAGSRIFKGGGSYNVGIAFFDSGGRTDGVHAIEAVSVPVTPYDFSQVTTGIGWQLPSGGATSEIPAWADTYAICITRNNDILSFVECYTDTIRYAIFNDDGTYDVTNTSYSGTYDGIAIDISGLLAAGMGYVYADGDYVVLAMGNGAIHTLAVRANWGNYVITELKDIGGLTSATARVEIITPAKGGDVYYEATPRHRINRLSGARYYSVTSGTIAGDVFILDRGDPIFVEAMSPNDTVWQQWHPSLGKPTSKATRERAPFFATRVRWGDTWHPAGPAAFAAFYPLNYVDGDPAAGTIRAMRNLDRGATGGTVLVAIAEERVLTGYVRVTELVDQRGESTLVRTDTFLAKLDMLAAEAGTTHPESVVQIDNYILFVDSRRGEVIRYSIGGVTPVSKLSGWSTITNAWAARLRGYQDAFGQSVWVPAGMDRGTGEYVVALREYGLRRRSSKYGHDPKLWDYLAGAVLDTSLLVPQGTTTITLTGTTVGEWHEVDISAGGLATVSVRVDGVEVFYGSGLTAYKAYFFSTAPTHVIEIDLVEDVVASYSVRQVEVDRHEADPVVDRSLVWSNAYERLTTSWPIAWDYWAGGLPWSLACYRGRLVRIEEGKDANNPQLFGYAVDGFVSFLLQYSPVPYKLYGMTIDGDGVDYVHIKSGDHYDQATDAEAANMRMYAGRIRVPVFKDMLTDTADVFASRYNGETLFGRAPSVVVVCNDSRSPNYVELVTVNVTADKGHIEAI